MVTIQTYFDTTEAGLAQGLLESRGIQSVLLGVDSFNVVLPGGSLPGGIRLQVAEENAEEARGIVQDGEGVTPITDDFVPPEDSAAAVGDEPASSSKAANFRGTYTALITPFRDGRVDTDAYARFIDFQIAGEVDGVVAVGTTGESATLDHDEHLEVIRLAVAAARGRIKVIAGTGSNSTQEAITMTQAAETLGVDAALVVAPYYNKPSQEGLYRHFRAIAQATKLPIILYSVPSRCGVEIGVETTRRLADDCPNIVAIKEAGGSVDRISQLRAALPTEFIILSGDDGLALPSLAAGAVGVISVTSNVIPAEVSQMVRAFARGKADIARALHARYYPLHKDLFIEPNPVPAKRALSWMFDWLTPDVRLPLCEMSPATLARLRRTLVSLELLKA